MRPMILKDIADMTRLDISTISRVVNSKYIQTHFGIYPLKYFFSEGMQTDSGEEVSTREIKKILQDCIDSEDKRKPLTDDRLSVILNEKGIPDCQEDSGQIPGAAGTSCGQAEKGVVT